MKRSNSSIFTFNFNCVACLLRNAFRYCNFFSLDAVLVALLWQELLARSAAVSLGQVDRLLLGLSVWSVYILDHLLDATSTQPFLKKKGIPIGFLSNQAPRHHFVKKYRWYLSLLFFATLLGDLSMAEKLPHSIFLVGLVLGGITLCYLCANFFFALQGRWFQGREVIIALIFVGGCALVPLMQMKFPLLLVIPMCSLSFLTFLNCLLIARMEGDVPLSSLWPAFFPPPKFLLGLVLFFGVVKWSHLSCFEIALMVSFGVLSLIPIIAKKAGYEIASWATDGALIVGAIIGLLS